MSVPQEIKTKVKNDWLRAFPELAAYTQICFYKIGGPIIFGIEIMKSNFGDRYRPYFNICPLWKGNVTQCMERPILLFSIHNKKNLTIDIDYNKHDIFFEEAVYCTRNYIQMPFEGNISLKSIYKVIDQNSLINDAWGIIQAYILKLYLQLYLEQKKEIEKLLKEIEKKKGQLLSSYFEHFFGSFEVWFQNLKESLSHREEFMKRIEINKQDKKLQRLVVSEIIV